jgi:glycosyltransferase involved in cell wall biosynthesis
MNFTALQPPPIVVPPAIQAKKGGWPWTEAIPLFPKTMPDGKPWPKISIVTPSYNQVAFLEETIRSILCQGYPNLEFILIDGGSTDGSVEIIQHYASCTSYWVSEPDKGQSNAILKGFARASGEIMAWINSDDFYAPGSFMAIANAASKTPSSLWFAGRCDTVLNGQRVETGHRWQGNGVEEWFFKSILMQPGVFWRSSLWQENGGLEESLHYSFDYELWLRFASVQPFPSWLKQCVAYYRSHGATKTSSHPELFVAEDEVVRSKHAALWQVEAVQHRIRALKNRDKAYAILRTASNTQNVVQRSKIIKQAIQACPQILRSPVYYYIISKAFFRGKLA